MKVILKKEVQSLGEAGDVVEVKDGYARNFLMPFNLAELATKGALQNRENNLARIQAKTEKLHEEAQRKAELIESIGSLQIQAKAGETGKLFGAVTTKKLAEELFEQTGVEVDRRNISLDNPINKLGEYKMKLKISSKVVSNIPVEVLASEIIEEQSLLEEVEEELESAE